MAKPTSSKKRSVKKYKGPLYLRILKIIAVVILGLILLGSALGAMIHFYRHVR